MQTVQLYADYAIVCRLCNCMQTVQLYADCAHQEMPDMHADTATPDVAGSIAMKPIKYCRKNAILVTRAIEPYKDIPPLFY